jgi:hypothetical protein
MKAARVTGAGTMVHCTVDLVFCLTQYRSLRTNMTAQLNPAIIFGGMEKTAV